MICMHSGEMKTRENAFFGGGGWRGGGVRKFHGSLSEISCDFLGNFPNLEGLQSDIAQPQNQLLMRDLH